MNEQQYHILYVDDEQRNLTTFKAAFREYYCVHTALSGEEALTLLKEQPVDLVISDQRMPGMTGVELLEKVIAGYPDTVRMILTGYSDMQAIIDAINKGQIAYYITKPWRMEQLKYIIDKSLEAYDLRRRNIALEKEKEELRLRAEIEEKQRVLSQLENLKNQINPHFLFNALNNLYVLIDRDTQQAREFVLRLSRVYRYLLEKRDEVVTTLEQELAFIADYLFLQKVRFNHNLQVAYDISPAQRKRYILPYTLQLLVENAIKHNVASRQHPLRIEMSVEQDKTLLVRNTFQPRPEAVNSTGVGQQNLRARYSLLSSRPVQFGPENGYYVARIPLLETEES